MLAVKVEGLADVSEAQVRAGFAELEAEIVQVHQLGPDFVLHLASQDAKDAFLMRDGEEVLERTVTITEYTGPLMTTPTPGVSDLRAACQQVVLPARRHLDESDPFHWVFNWQVSGPVLALALFVMTLGSLFSG